MPARVSAATTDLDVHDSASTSTASRWAEFAEKVSGEWDGFGADFTAEGQAVELPESVVPEAYREWEVKVFDWQTQCPTLAESRDNSPSLTYKSIKLLPTVGCEADAATIYTVHERNISAPHNSAFAYLATGSYVAEWPIDSASAKSMELEHCLIDPTNRESRVRIIQVLQLQDSELKLLGIKVFVEQWYGPFRNGDQLGGCSIRDSAFATTERLKASQVSGGWQGLSSVAKVRTSHNMIQQLGDECASKSIRDEGDLILLPKQIWCSVKRANDDETRCEVGWLMDEGRAISSQCIFSSTAELKEIAITNETKTPK
ncbi:glycerol kinase [Perilla frutescens var. hirtella]|nr:glycerol kinase [Perilla frutescens var. hirtella]KAH6812003.1 glycerol kinase [Perilla frutescens var. frutescens]